ncbi:hypothetical protein N7492_009387 [Penicillium capsulatum]|uniref:Uncharacterized protein n=1 Tax=Penicillium capsulatum TaxID=69766 RepID=A0A9W9LHP9_9EURO|nr:hypothetical protein N7492_009387 [Penicillium capsulatum]KAJ6106780.1 hypothetical protein N7512_010297 [Penicillium capsulatum]
MLSFVGLYSNVCSDHSPAFPRRNVGSDMASPLPSSADAISLDNGPGDDNIDSPRHHNPQSRPEDAGEHSELDRVSPSPCPFYLDTRRGPEGDLSIGKAQPSMLSPITTPKSPSGSCGAESEITALPPLAIDSNPQTYTQWVGTETEYIFSHPPELDSLPEAIKENGAGSPESSIQAASSLPTVDDSTPGAVTPSTTSTQTNITTSHSLDSLYSQEFQRSEDTGETYSETSTNGADTSVFDEDYFSDTSSYTASLLSDVKNFTYENGRRYHSYREGHYVLPNDEQEQDRQDLLHHVRNLTLNGALFRAPLGPHLQRVLDLGTGTGIWAIDFADSYPSAEVIGTDLSPIQPSWVPPNLRFLVDDAESPWLFSASRPFDFIHARDLGGAIADWPRLLRQGYGHLRPGGWIELQEFEVTLRSDDDSLQLAPTLREFLGRLHEASEEFQRPMNIAEGHRQRLIEAGFEDVYDEVYKVRPLDIGVDQRKSSHPPLCQVPSSGWSEDAVQKQIGRYNLCSLLMAVESYSLALFTRVLGWSNSETQVFLAGVRRDLKNPAVHTYCNLHIVYGRRPWNG